MDGGLEATVLPAVTKLDALFVKFQDRINNEIVKTNLVSVGSLWCVYTTRDRDQLKWLT